MLVKEEAGRLLKVVPSGDAGRLGRTPARAARRWPTVWVREPVSGEWELPPGLRSMPARAASFGPAALASTPPEAAPRAIAPQLALLY